MIETAQVDLPTLTFLPGASPAQSEDDDEVRPLPGLIATYGAGGKELFSRSEGLEFANEFQCPERTSQRLGIGATD